MARNRKTAKNAGTRLETQMTRWLTWAFHPTVFTRPRLRGRQDVGDITGLTYMGDPVVIECKATANGEDGRPLGVRREFEEALTEADNRDSPWPVLVKKRDGVGDRDWRAGGSQLAIIRISDLRSLLKNCVDEYTVTSLVQLPRNPRLIGMDAWDLFTLFNHGLDLGPDE